jgi:hypothetical protein
LQLGHDFMRLTRFFPCVPVSGLGRRGDGHARRRGCPYTNRSAYQARETV